MNSKKFAITDFSYTKKKDTVKKDIVKCLECQSFTLSNGIAEDNPKAERELCSGKCKFTRVPCGNVATEADLGIFKLPLRVNAYRFCGLNFMQFSDPDNDPQIENVNSDSDRSEPSDLNEDIDITVFWDADTNAYLTAKLSDVLGSKQPTYASYERRLHSFTICTCDTICEKKEELAKAGFFYLSGLFESSDQTMCYYCGKCLRAWKRTDDPVEEHIKWYPQCKFIKKILAKNLKEKSELSTERTDHESETPTNATTNVC